MTATAVSASHYMPRITEGNYTATVYNLIKDEKHEQVSLQSRVWGEKDTCIIVSPPSTVRIVLEGRQDPVERTSQLPAIKSGAFASWALLLLNAGLPQRCLDVRAACEVLP